ncbi:hypothetical protein PAEPH01_0670 [Pancytospora epiphaga]|nr:hypothetical protein PAEPH01_0670 [Pancytospora epiphaga]
MKVILILLITGFYTVSIRKRLETPKELWLNLLFDNENKVKYDYKVSMDFIKNYHQTGVFSPTCSELNILMQVICKEYGLKNIEKARNFFNDLTSKLTKINTKKLNMRNRAYIPDNSVTFHSYDTESEFMLTRYNYYGISEVLAEYSIWAMKISGCFTKDSLRKEDLNKRKSVYASVAHFNEEWEVGFPKKATFEAKFFSKSKNNTTRKYLSVENKYGYDVVSKYGIEFTVVVVPYAEKIVAKDLEWCYADDQQDFARCMIYLIPKKKKMGYQFLKNTVIDLSDIWGEFFMHVKGDIRAYLLKSVKWRYIHLEVPKITQLRTSLNLEDVLKNTYIASLDSSTLMSSYIRITEEGAKTDCIVKTLSAGHAKSKKPRKIPEVVANLPYISLVFDMRLGRILFLLKDCGEKKE